MRMLREQQVRDLVAQVQQVDAAIMHGLLAGTNAGMTRSQTQSYTVQEADGRLLPPLVVADMYGLWAGNQTDLFGFMGGKPQACTVTQPII